MARPKNSADYWKWRQARRMYEQMNDADKVGEDISRLYAAAARQLTKEIEKIFFKYQQKWGLTQADAKRLLSKVRGKKTVDILKAMLPFVDEEVRDDFRAQIESGAYAARIKRFEALQDNLDKVMTEVYRQDEQRQREHYVQFAEESYNREIHEIQKQVGFQFEFSEISEEAIDMVLNRKWCGESFSDAIWKNTQKVADEVRDVLLMELMTGQRQEDAARALAERMAVGAMQSRRIIRTESNYISGQVQLQAYEECGAEKYMYVATLDSRTDEECGMLDGKTFFVKDAQPGVNFHPMHPNCRCTDIIALDDDTLKNLQRRARNPETGENELVPAGTTWEKWKKQNRLDSPHNEAGHKRQRNSGTAIARKRIESSDYPRKLSKLGESKKVHAMLRDRARAMLNHRNETLFEDLVFVDSQTGKWLGRFDYDKQRECYPSDAMKRMVKQSDDYTIIALHNHPESSMPSTVDIETALKNKYKYGLIACHDGSIIKYKASEKCNIPAYNSALANLGQKGYTEDAIKSFIKIVDSIGVEVEIL